MHLIFSGVLVAKHQENPCKKTSMYLLAYQNFNIVE